MPSSETHTGTGKPAGPDAAKVRAALEARAEDLFRRAFGEPVRPGASDWRAKENDALSMRMKGDRRGLWCDHSAGEGGDTLDLAAMVFCGLTSARSDFPRVLAEASRWLGNAPMPDRRKPADRDTGDRAYLRALVQTIEGWTRPVRGSPAEVYLAGRGIRDLPETGLAWLPPIPRLRVRDPDRPALVVWAMDGNGHAVGGQRILIDADGRKAAVEIPKPAFGTIGGAPARFPAAGSVEKDAPLVIAEGPETALTLRSVTGLETWAVFGVSGWKRAPVPVDRVVILAPDRDAPGSPAGRAFRAALAPHLDRGCRLRIAEAPEPEGSKRDLNDTLMTRGAFALLGAIASARRAGA